MGYRGKVRVLYDPKELPTLRKSKLREILSELNARAMRSGLATETTVGVWRRHDLVSAIRAVDRRLTEARVLQ